MIRYCLLLICVYFIGVGDLFSQENSSGKIIRISEKNITVVFENNSVKVGEEVLIKRNVDIKDPLTNKIRGSRSLDIAKGIVSDFGPGKATVRIVEIFENQKIRENDSVILTGVEKKIARSAQPVYKEIKKITDNEVETAFTSDDEVSEGDIFLIQRTETIYDPETHAVTGTNEVNVGKLKVSSVTEKSTIAKPFDLKMQPLMTDKVVKESEYAEYMENLKKNTEETADIRGEVEQLKSEVENIKSLLDSLLKTQKLQSNEIGQMKNEITTVLRKLLSSDVSGTKIQKKNNEVIILDKSGDVLGNYKKALDDCLKHRFDSAIKLFNFIIEKNPDSEITENCRYWIAQSYFSMNKFNEAEKIFKEIIDDKRFKHKDDDSSIMLGITYFKLEKMDEAINQFKSFIEIYPESEYKGKVQEWIKKMS